MKKIYKSIILLSLFLLTACGYTPLYIAKKENFYISEIQSNNKNNYYYYFKNHLKSYMQGDQVNKKNLKIEIDISKNKKTISKDSKGNPLIYSLEISSNVKVLEDENLVLTKKIQKKFKYNNKSDIFELYRYEEKVEKNLIKLISDDIIFFISKNIEN